MNEKAIKQINLDDPRELLSQVEKAIAEPNPLPAEGPSIPFIDDNHPTIKHGEALAKHLEAVMSDYGKRVATAADLIRQTVKQLAEDQTKIEQYLDSITKGCNDISKVGNHR